MEVKEKCLMPTKISPKLDSIIILTRQISQLLQFISLDHCQRSFRERVTFPSKTVLEYEAMRAFKFLGEQIIIVELCILIQMNSFIFSNESITKWIKLSVWNAIYRTS